MTGGRPETAAEWWARVKEEHGPPPPHIVSRVRDIVRLHSSALRDAPTSAAPAPRAAGGER